MHQTARRLLLSAGGLTAALLLPAYLVWHGTPRPVPTAPVGRARAQAAALAAVGGGQLLTAETTVRGHRPLYAFAIRPAAPGAATTGLPAAATLVQVLVSPASGRVVAVIPQPAAPAASGTAAPTGAAAPIAAPAAEAIAVRAVGGGEALAVTRTEPTDHGVWSYRVRVLEPTSARVDVTVSRSGRVLGVRSGVGR